VDGDKTHEVVEDEEDERDELGLNQIMVGLKEGRGGMKTRNCKGVMFRRGKGGISSPFQSLLPALQPALSRPPTRSQIRRTTTISASTPSPS
jgi:hypothetical protein